MRWARLGQWVLGALGVLCVLVGVAAAVYVGPDDHVHLPDREVPDGAPVTVVDWRLLAYRDTTLTVTAAASDGAVFLGAAHPVDLSSYLGDHRRFEVRGVTATGTLTGSPVGTQADSPASGPTDPAAGGWWRLTARGEGPQHLDVPLTGEPVSVIAVVPSGSRLTMGLGVTVPGSFRTALGVAAIGSVLVAAALLLRRRDRGRRAATDEGAVVGAEVGTDPSDPATGRAGASARTVTLSGIVIAGLSLSGCVALPTSVALSTGDVTEAGLAPEQVAAVLADYDRRNNDAIAQIAKGAPETVWAQADAGLTYAADVATTAYRRAGGETAEPKSITYTSTAMYSGRFSAYPTWVVVATKRAVSGTTDAPTGSYLVLQRDSVQSPWRVASDAYSDQEVPAAVATGTDATADQADAAAGADLMARLAGLLTSGADARFQPSGTFDELRKDIGSYGEYRASLSCRPAVADHRPGDATRVVKTATGRLAVLTVRCEQTIYANGDTTIFWKSPLATAYQLSTDPYPSVWRFLVVTAVLNQAPDGTVTVLGSGVDAVRTNDVDWAS